MYERELVQDQIWHIIGDIDPGTTRNRENFTYICDPERRSGERRHSRTAGNGKEK